MPEFIKHADGRHFSEHNTAVDISRMLPDDVGDIFFQGNENSCCVAFNKKCDTTYVDTSYYVGLDWVGEHVIYVEPKINIKAEPNQNSAFTTDILSMLFAALDNPVVVGTTKDLYEIKWQNENIAIAQQQDLLTPLLLAEFFAVVKRIVRKGLKKTYYKIEENLTARVKGKIVVSRTLKQNVLKNKSLNTVCSYDEFGYNNLENRLIKKALLFATQYILRYKNSAVSKYLENTLGFIMPAFETVSDQVSVYEVNHTHANVFYKEYKTGIELARKILMRFGFNIGNVNQLQILTPPFWIDMSKLFEIHVLNLLKQRFGADVHYHFRAKGNELDYLLKTADYRLVIDAKYKVLYRADNEWDIENIRQISGYARLEDVYSELEIAPTDVIDCLIIYPGELVAASQYEDATRKFLHSKLLYDKLPGFVRFYKMSAPIPVVREHVNNP